MHPEVFQGSLKKKNYFEGWFLKHCSADQDKVLALIPGVAMNSADSHSFIQVMDGISGKTNYISYPLDAFSWDKKEFRVRVGDSEFSREGSTLNIKKKDLELSGRISYLDSTAYPVRLIAPGIMGWYAWVPFMECYHGIVSPDHSLEGSLTMNNQLIDFAGGNGYIEKDWGTSFPDPYLWLQCNNFPVKGASLFVSYAKIPWLGRFFMGFIAFLYLDGQYYPFTTYNGSKMAHFSLEGEEIYIELRRKSLVLSARIRQASSGELQAPVTGNMTRRIRESNDSLVETCLADGQVTLFKETGRRAGLEVAGNIFDYF